MKRLCEITLFIIWSTTALLAQSSGRLVGKVQDADGAVIPAAQIFLLHAPDTTATSKSAGDGTFRFEHLTPGMYNLRVEAKGFATFDLAQIAVAGDEKRIIVTLRIEIEEQVTVTTQANGVSLDADENKNATVLKGSDIEALADDPDALQTELKALAGPAAGPDGGQIYVDGYTGGQLPPKSSILEIRVNQNPFSAEYDRIGYGRIDIVIKPGAVTFGGHIRSSYLNSALNTSNPLASIQPSYQYYSLAADLTGPLAKKFSYFAAAQYWQRQNQNFLKAIDPTDASTTPRILSEALPAPYSTTTVFGRIDGQIGQHILQAQWTFLRTQKTNTGTGGLNLQEQAYSLSDLTNILQFRDTTVLSPKMLNEVSARWIRERMDQVPNSTRPSVTVQGAFVTGGSIAGRAVNHQDNLEVHDYITLTEGKHVLRVGALARSYRVADFTNAGSNGNYLFQSLADYSAQKPYQYSATIVQNPLAKVLLFDGALFLQDEWRPRPDLNVSLGLRVEGQNRVHDHFNWGPRSVIAWSPHQGTKPGKIVLRAAGGVFYNRFAATQQVLTIHNNGFFQRNYVVNQPGVFDPNKPLPASSLISSPASRPYIYTLDPNFRVSRNVQAAIGMDRSFGKFGSININYLYTRGVHQYYINNVNAPFFDAQTYTITGTAPSTYNYQLQSGGDFRQHQVILTSNTSYKHLSLHAVYTFNHTMTDVQGKNYFPSIAHDPKSDYGRATFTAPHQLQAFATYALPLKISISALAFAESGRPYNIVIGNDLTGNNQSNARPTFGKCGATDVFTTKIGCLDANPSGKGESLVPYGLGTGPASGSVYLTVNRTFNFGPKKASQPSQPPNSRYSLTVITGATNLFNVSNLGPPNGVLLSPLFSQPSEPPTGTFSLSSPGNRTIYFTSYFSF